MGAATCSSTTAATSHDIGWRVGNALYWVSNTLLEDLTNPQMLAIAESARPVG